MAKKGDGVISVPVSTDTGEIIFDIEYDYNENNGRVFPKITKINLKEWVLTELLDHNLKERLNNHIFRELNKDTYHK